MGRELELGHDDEQDVDPFEPTEDDAVVRGVRRISIHVEADLTVEVIEPPTVHNAEVKALARHAVMRTLTNLQIGVPTDITVRVTAGAARGQR